MEPCQAVRLQMFLSNLQETYIAAGSWSCDNHCPGPGGSARQPAHSRRNQFTDRISVVAGVLCSNSIGPANRKCLVCIVAEPTTGVYAHLCYAAIELQAAAHGAIDLG